MAKGPLSNKYKRYFKRRKRHPAPIVSLAKILRYRLASMGVVTKTIDLFNEMVFRKSKRLDSLPTGEAKQKAAVKTTITKRIERATLEVPQDDAPRNTNVNAAQRKESLAIDSSYYPKEESAINLSNNRKGGIMTSVNSPLIGGPLTSVTGPGNVGPSTSVVSPRKGIAWKLVSRRRNRNTRLKDTRKAPTKRASPLELHSQIARTRSGKGQNPRHDDPTKMTESYSKKPKLNQVPLEPNQASCHDTMSHSLHPTTSQKIIPTIYHGTTSKPVALRTRSKIRQNRKRVVFCINPEHPTKQPVYLSKNSEPLTFVEKDWPKLRKPLSRSPKSKHEAVANKSPVKGKVGSAKKSCVHMKRRWADVASGSSKNVFCVTQGQMNIITSDKEVVRKIFVTKRSLRNKKLNQKHSVDVPAASNSTENSISHVKHNSREQDDMLQTWATVVKVTDNGKNAQGLIPKAQSSKPPPPLTVAPMDNPDQSDFPSLMEQKGKRMKKEKYYLCRPERISSSSNTKASCGKSPSMSYTYRKLNGGNICPTIVDKCKGKSKKKRKRDATGELGRKTLPNITITTQTEDSSHDTWQIDDMQEVVIQPVCGFVPLHETRLDSKNKSTQTQQNPIAMLDSMDDTMYTNSEAVSTPSSTQITDQQSKLDICRRFDAMTVDGVFDDSTSSLYPIQKRKRTLVPSPKFAKSPRRRAQREVGKDVQEGQGPSPKKISTRYRALLRRDYGKVDVKTATEMFNRDRWADIQQKDKVCDRFDDNRQRRNQSKTDDPLEGTSQQVAQCNQNDLYYLLPRTNGCPTM